MNKRIDINHILYKTKKTKENSLANLGDIQPNWLNPFKSQIVNLK